MLPFLFYFFFSPTVIVANPRFFWQPDTALAGRLHHTTYLGRLCHAALVGGFCQRELQPMTMTNQNFSMAQGDSALPDHHGC